MPALPPARRLSAISLADNPSGRESQQAVKQAVKREQRV
jgi:hypothetical protein